MADYAFHSAPNACWLTCLEVSQSYLKTWRVLTKLRTAPARATNLLRALLVLTNLEVNR